MECFVYKSRKKSELYLFVAQAEKFDVVPAPLMQNFGTPEFVMRLELTPERKLARSDAQEVMRSLREKGFFLQMPPQDPALETARQMRSDNSKLRV